MAGGYDSATRRLQVVRGGSDNASGAAFTYAYKPGTNLVETVTASNGVKTTYGYDQAGRPDSITASKGNVTLFSDTFDYNTNNQKWQEAVVTLMLDHSVEVWASVLKQRGGASPALRVGFGAGWRIRRTLIISPG